MIAQVQHDSDRARERSKKCRDDTAPPDDVKLDVFRFRLIQVCTSEQLASAVRLIRELFPRLSLRDDDRFDFIEAPSFQSGGWSFLGTLHPDTGVKTKSPLSDSANWPLPNEIESVQLEAHKILPATGVLTADVFLAEPARNTIRSIQSSYYLAPTQYLAFSSGSFGTMLSSTTPTPESEQEKAFRAWLDHCRAAAEVALRSLLVGQIDCSDGRTPSLPAIELVALDKTPVDDEAFREWAGRARSFTRSIGDMGLSFNAFKSEDLVISLGRENRRNAPPVWRFYLLGDTGHVNRRRGEDLRDIINEVEIWIAITATASRIDSAIHSLQFASSEGRNTWRMRRQFRLYRYLIDTFAEYSRFAVDLTEDSIWEKSNAFARFKPLAEIMNRPSRDLSLIGPSIRRYFGSVDRYARVQMDAMRDELAFRNMRGMYNLQWATVFIAVVALVCSILALLQQEPASTAPQEQTKQEK